MKYFLWIMCFCTTALMAQPGNVQLTDPDSTAQLGDSTQRIGHTNSAEQGDHIEESIRLARTKLLDEFMGRFNGELNVRGDTIPADSQSVAYRKRMLWALLAPELMAKIESDETLMRKYAEFSYRVTAPENAVHLSLAENDFAQVLCGLEYDGQKKEIWLTMEYEVDSASGGASWVIAGVDTAFESLLNIGYSINHYIPPSNHEVRFLKLSSALHDTLYSASYFPQDFRPDLMTAFLMGIRYNQLHFNYSSEVKFIFTLLDHWEITIEKKEYPLESLKNYPAAGWLITELDKTGPYAH